MFDFLDSLALIKWYFHNILEVNSWKLINFANFKDFITRRNNFYQILSRRNWKHIKFRLDLCTDSWDMFYRGCRRYILRVWIGGGLLKKLTTKLFFNVTFKVIFFLSHRIVLIKRNKSLKGTMSRKWTVLIGNNKKVLSLLKTTFIM